MDDERTTLAVQRYLDMLAGDSPTDPIIRDLLERAVSRLHQLCSSLLYRSYPRLTQSPLNLQSDEMLSAVVERLLKALREARPATVRQFFALASQHMRWELNDLARRLDKTVPALHLPDALIDSPESSASQLSPTALRLLEVIETLPDDEREVFSLVRIQGISQSEAAEMLSVTVRTIQRRLNRSLLILNAKLNDLNFATSPNNS